MYLAIDVETSYKPFFKPWQREAFLSTVAIYRSDGVFKTWVFHHEESDPFTTDRAKIKEIQSELDMAGLVVAHNFKFDLLWLRWLGLDLDKSKIFCTMVAEYLLRAQKAETLSLQGLTGSKLDTVSTEYWERGINTDKVPLLVLLPYNIQDCKATLELAQKQLKELREHGMLKLARMEFEKIKCLATIEAYGIEIDLEELERQGHARRQELTEIDRRLCTIVGRDFNIESNDQLSAALFGGIFKVDGVESVSRKRKDGSIRTYTRKAVFEESFDGIGFTPNQDWAAKKDGYWHTSKDVIAQLTPQAKTKEQRELLKLLIDRSAISQQIKTFINGFSERLVEGRLHPSMNNTVTVTGRLSSSNPNFQNIPRDNSSEIKRFFISSKGYLVDADFSQLEWQAAAFLSQCPVMLREIQEGVDQHAAVGEELFGGRGVRTDWKIFNFRMIYGGSAYSYFMDVKMPNFSLKKWDTIVKQFYKKYHGLARWHDQLVKAVRKGGGTYTNITGRKFRFDKVRTAHGRDYRRPQILNYPVQSFATGDVVPLAMVLVDRQIREEKLDAVMCNQVHDSIMYDCSHEHAFRVAKIITKVMSDMPTHIENHYGFKVNVPFGGDAKVGPNWLDMEEV